MQNPFDWLKGKIRKWILYADNGSTQVVTINYVEEYEQVAERNELWYKGVASELYQYYTQYFDYIGNLSFWHASCTTRLGIRKIHSGMPALMVDTLAAIVIGDFNGIVISDEDETKEKELQELWDKIEKDNNFTSTLKDTIKKALIYGDGSFKISIDKELSDYPIIEFIPGTKVSYTKDRGRLKEVHFFNTYTKGENANYRLRETYGKGYAYYKLFGKSEKESFPLSTLDELKGYNQSVRLNKDMFLAIPLMFDRSERWEGRGKALYEGKLELFDSLDECVSQWQEALRESRTKTYIPENLIPKDAENGAMLTPNAFDNKFITLATDNSENAQNQIQQVTTQVPYEGLLATYTTLLEQTLQGIISPSTIGIDVKKLDNAEAQREKEKTTLYTRNKIVKSLEETIPQVVEMSLRAFDFMQNGINEDEKEEKKYNVSISFGEYANPSFEAQVETIGKAKTFGIMSVEESIEQLYGDSKTDEEKCEEVKRIKSEGQDNLNIYDDLSSEDAGEQIETRLQ